MILHIYLQISNFLAFLKIEDIENVPGFFFICQCPNKLKYTLDHLQMGIQKHTETYRTMIALLGTHLTRDLYALSGSHLSRV